MKGYIRIGDWTTGHPPYSPRPAIQGCTKVIIQGKPVVCVGMQFSPHIGQQDGVTMSMNGDSKVMMQGRPVLRNMAKMLCGESVIGTTTKVF